MTQGKKFKKKVRERMAQTGESYTTARAALLRSSSEKDANLALRLVKRMVDGRVEGQSEKARGEAVDGEAR